MDYCHLRFLYFQVPRVRSEQQKRSSGRLLTNAGLVEPPRNGLREEFSPNQAIVATRKVFEARGHADLASEKPRGDARGVRRGTLRAGRGRVRDL